MSTRYFVIGQDGRSYGPLTIEDVRIWIADGRAGRHSRVRLEDDNRWKPLHEISELAESLRPAPAPYSPDPDPEVPGAATPDASGRFDSSADAVLAHSRPLNIASAFARAWALLRHHFVELAGWSLTSGVVVYLVTLIPYVGWPLASLVVNTALTGVISVVYLARIRGRRATMSDLAAALTATAGNLYLVGITQTLLIGAGAFLLLVPGLYLAVAYLFAIPLAIDKRLPFWTALELSRRVVHRQWWSTFALVLLSGGLVLGGALIYGVGLILAVPLSTGALMYAYEDLFGHESIDRAPS